MFNITNGLLGTRQTGEQSIKIIDIGFEKIPRKKNEDDDRSRTVDNVYLEVSESTLIDMARYYSELKDGDEVEGIYSNIPYYEIVGIKVDGADRFSDIVEAMKAGWSIYSKKDSRFKNATYLVYIL